MKILNKVIALSLCGAMGLALTACAKNYDGTYKASLDCTDIFSDAMGMELEGTLEAEFILTMEKGEYTIEIDADKFQTDMTDFISSNIDTIIVGLFGTDDEAELDEYATYMGYADAAEMKQGLVDEMMGDISADDFEIGESGKYTVAGDTIKFDSETSDDFDGTVNDGKISIELADDEGIFGGDVELVFEAEK